LGRYYELKEKAHIKGQNSVSIHLSSLEGRILQLIRNIRNLSPKLSRNLG
jgi:hypothetical protein